MFALYFWELADLLDCTNMEKSEFTKLFLSPESHFKPSYVFLILWGCEHLEILVRDRLHACVSSVSHRPTPERTAFQWKVSQILISSLKLGFLVLPRTGRSSLRLLPLWFRVWGWDPADRSVFFFVFFLTSTPFLFLFCAPELESLFWYCVLNWIWA